MTAAKSEADEPWAPGDIVKIIDGVGTGSEAVVTEAKPTHCTVIELDPERISGLRQLWPSLHQLQSVSTAWRLGTRVRLEGLTRAALVRFNGLTGVVVKHPREGHPVWWSRKGTEHEPPGDPHLQLVVRVDKPCRPVAGSATVRLEARHVKLLEEEEAYPGAGDVAALAAQATALAGQAAPGEPSSAQHAASVLTAMEEAVTAEQVAGSSPLRSPGSQPQRSISAPGDRLVSSTGSLHSRLAEAPGGLLQRLSGYITPQAQGGMPAFLAQRAAGAFTPGAEAVEQAEPPPEATETEVHLVQTTEEYSGAESSAGVRFDRTEEVIACARRAHASLLLDGLPAERNQAEWTSILESFESELEQALTPPNKKQLETRFDSRDSQDPLEVTSPQNSGIVQSSRKSFDEGAVLAELAENEAASAKVAAVGSQDREQVAASSSTAPGPSLGEGRSPGGEHRGLLEGVRLEAEEHPPPTIAASGEHLAPIGRPWFGGQVEFRVGEQLVVLTDSGQEWRDAVVVDFYPDTCEAEGYGIPGGTVKVVYDRGIKWIMPHNFARTLRRKAQPAPTPSCSSCYAWLRR